MNSIDLDTAWRTVWGEARGEPWPGKIAVAWVIKNRADTGYRGTTPDEVCKWRLQFSCRNENDPNAKLLEEVDPATNDRARDCVAATALVLAGLVPDPTGGARHYHADYVKPNWAEGQKPSLVVGHHLFYVGVK